MLECFVVLIDDRTMKCLDVNSGRCDICRISSTLVQLTVCEDWGGKMLGETYLPYWTDLAEAGISIGADKMQMQSLKKGCSGRCKCIRAELKCP